MVDGYLVQIGDERLPKTCIHNLEDPLKKYND